MKLFLSQEELACDKSSRPIIRRCVFWDFALRDGKGGWSTEGCMLNSTDDGRVTCHCDHLTNFAVLAVCSRPQLKVVDPILGPI